VFSFSGKQSILSAQMAISLDQRLTLANVLPPTFICAVVGTIWSIYIGLHLLPMLQLVGSKSEGDIAIYTQGVWQTIISQTLTSMFALCFARALLGQPGSVPDEPEWQMGGGKGRSSCASTELTTRELKGSTGDRRSCKWCSRYKPDRCHHCRICKACVLKMDHHCPWIMNCVGFANHKFFFLLVVYAVCSCLYIACTMSESVQRSVLEETPATNRFLLVLALVLAIIMGSLTATFLSFHTWLMMKGMTTIEFCEKNLSPAPSSSSLLGSKGVSYDLGIEKNLKAVFGPHWWLWLLPLSPPEGSGVSFHTAASLPQKGECDVAEPEWTGHENGDVAP